MNLERFLLAAFTGTAIGAFASAWQAQPVWLLEIPCALTLFWNPRSVPAGLQAWARRISRVFVATAVALGLVFMAYFIPAPWGQRLVLTAGYGLAVCSALFLFSTAAWPVGSTLLPAVLSLLVVGCLNPAYSARGPAALAGAALFAWLALDGLRGRRVPKPALALVRQAIRLITAGGLAFAIAAGLAQAAPWGQRQVEGMFLSVVRSTFYRAFSGDSRLGDVEELKLSRRVVMRVWTDRPQKLRARVFTVFDGRAWHALAGQYATYWAKLAGGYKELREPTAVSLSPTALPAEPNAWLDQWLRQVPGNDFLVAGHDARGTAGPPAIRTRIVQIVFNEGTLVSPGDPVLLRVPFERVRLDSYQVFSSPGEAAAEMYALVNRRDGDIVAPEALAPESRWVWSQPGPADKRLRELAQRLGEGAQSDEERVRRTIAWLGAECHYSLAPGRFASDFPVSEFLFEKKKGYCEYFATAAAQLLRLQGVPCRYVTGFNVSLGNRRGDHYVVREKDAHAWIEVCLPGKGWVEVDPTPPDEYEALTAQAGDWLERLTEGVRAVFAEARVRLNLGDWRGLAALLWANCRALARLLLSVRLWLGLATTAALAGLLWPAWRAWRRFTTGRRLSPVRSDGAAVPPELAVLLRQLDREWARAGVARPPWRAPLEHLQTIPPEKLAPAVSAAAPQVIDCFYRAAFGGGTVPAAEIEQLKRSLPSA